MALRTGSLRHTVRIEERVPNKDKMGGQSGEWRVWRAGVAASIEPLKGKELFNAEQAQSEMIGRCKIRYREGLRPDMRIVYRGVAYGITVILNPSMKNEYLEIMLNQGKNEG